MLLIIQPEEGDLPGWRRIGDCYVNGIMNGVAFLGESCEIIQSQGDC